MFWRSVIKAAEWIGAVLAGLALVMGGGVWLLSRGPVSLDWLTPYVASSFSQSNSGMTARVDHTLIGLGPGPTLEIIARGLHLRRKDGKAELALPAVGLSLSAQAAMSGQVAPTRIVLHGARLKLLRAADGSFHFGLAGEQIGGNDWAETLLHELSHPPRHSGPFGHLRQITVTDAALTVDDRKLGVTWEAQNLYATLRRDGGGFTGNLALTIERGGSPTQVGSDLVYQDATHHLRMTLRFDSLRPSLYAALAPALAPFAAFDLPLAGTVSMALDTETRRVAEFWSDLQLGRGRIVNDRFAGGALKIERGALRAVFDPATQQLDLEHFEAELNAPKGPKLTFSGTLFHFDPLTTAPLNFTGHGEIHDLTYPDLPQLWPEKASFHAREWVLAHIQQGVLTHGEIDIGGTVLLGSSAGLVAKLDRVEGDLAYHDVAIQYFPPLSPVRNIDGVAHFDRATFDLLPRRAESRDVKITAGRVLLTKLDTDSEQAAIDVQVVGPLGTVLDELNKKPLRYAHALGIDPAGVKGTVDGELHFHLPMKKNLRFAQIDYSARGKIDDLGIDKILFARDLTAGALRVVVDRGGVDVTGNANLNGAPITLDWRENFSDDLIRSQYRLHGIFDDAARHELGIDWLPALVTGPLGVDLTFTRQRNDFAYSNVTLDLTNAALKIRQLGWTKKAGVLARAHLNITARDGFSTQITDLTIHGGGLDAALALTLTGGQINAQIASANIYRLAVGKTDVAGVVQRRPEGGWHAQLYGRSFDASRLLAEMQNAPQKGEPDPPLLIEADLGQVLLAPGRALTDVRAKLFSDGIHWQMAEIDASPSFGKSLALRFGGAAGARNLRLTSNDLGAVLRLLDISSKVEGGEVTVTAHAEDVDGQRVLSGQISGENYRVVGAPAFAQLLSLASLTGAASLANGKGIPFSRMQGDFVLDQGTVELHNARAYGEAIGINASGQFDYRRNTVDMSGTIVPAYLVNSLLSNIPVLGDLLFGGQGEGIFAAKFRVAGSTTDPGISVNPLSALAPGFLRGLFLFDAGNPREDNAQRTVSPKGG
jgi:AsmA-like C-terminal region/Protein of unknown function